MSIMVLLLLIMGDNPFTGEVFVLFFLKRGTSGARALAVDCSNVDVLGDDAVL